MQDMENRNMESRKDQTSFTGKVCVVTVTYGNRFRYLEKVIDACLKEGVDKIIVVDNNSHPESRQKLKELEKKEPKLKVIYLDENKGSAGGYKIGLKEAYKCKNCKFIWLLDDDNKPKKNSLKILKDFWNKINHPDKEHFIALLSYRKDRMIYKEAIMTNNPDLVLGRKNGFLGFHIFDLPKKFIKFIKRKIGIQTIKTFKEKNNIKFGEVSTTPYGGMFFHKNLLNTIGYPKEDLFLYTDDTEWSYRIIKNNGKIYLLLDSIIEDLEISWHLQRKNTFFYFLLNEGTDFRVYYMYRNRVYFERNNLVSNNFIYYLNMKMFFFILMLFKRKKNKKRFELFKRAVNDGLKGKLGKSYVYE